MSRFRKVNLNAIAGFVRLFTGVQANWINGQPETAQRIYYANHTSHLDCVVLLAVLPRPARLQTRAAAAADYWQKNKFRRWLADGVFNVIHVERTQVTRANNPLLKLKAALDEGSSIIIFPEGGRSDDNEIAEFKSGLYYLSKSRPNIELIPTYIDNASRVLPKGEFLPLPILCSVTFGKPIRLEAGESKQAFLERARRAVLEHAA